MILTFQTSFSLRVEGNSPSSTASAIIRLARKVPLVVPVPLDVVPNLTKGRVRVRMSYRTYQRVGYGYGCRTELTEGLGTGIDVVTSLPWGRERVWMFYRAYQRGRVWHGCLCPYPYPTSGVSTMPYPIRGYFPAGVPTSPKCRARVWISYRTYGAELTKLSGTGNTRGVYPLYTLVRTLPNTSSQNSSTKSPDYSP